jgi:anti-sigma-K factor RskA
MIDERHEELASLYAFDLLEGAELAQFEKALARDPNLKALVRELRDTSASLAHTAPAAQPPAALKQRVLASISTQEKGAPVPDNIVRPSSFGVWNLIPWAAAACFALSAAWLGQRYTSIRSETAALRNQREFAEITIKSVQQQLEAERILTRRQLQDAEQQMAGVTTQLGEARTQLGDRDRLLAEARTQQADRDRQIADSRAQLGDRERQVATLTQRIDALAGESSDRGRQLSEAKQLVAKLTDELKTQGDLANLKITALASMLKNSPQALAVAVWDPKKQEGMFAFENLPPLNANQTLELWVVEAKDGAKPVSAGVLNVGSDGKARVPFKPTAPVTAIAAFAVSREKNDGASSHSAPAEVIMHGHSR